MSLVFDPTEKQVDGEWKPVQITKDITIEFFVKRPSLEEQFVSHEMNLAVLAGISKSRSVYRVQTVVTDWKGVVDNNKEPLLFSWQALAALCSKYPHVGHALAILADDAFFSTAPLLEDEGNPTTDTTDSDSDISDPEEKDQEIDIQTNSVNTSSDSEGLEG